MPRMHWMGVGVILLFGGTALCQAPTQRGSSLSDDLAQAELPAPRKAGVMEPASRPEQLASIEGEAAEMPKWGPTPPEDVRWLMDHTRFGDILNYNGVRVYGWLDQGYTFASGGPGQLAVETRENRFGNEYLLNQA